MTIWLDLEDLVRYFHFSSRPTGIQRLTFEVARELSRLSGPDQEVRFCRHATTPSGFRTVHFPALEAGIDVAAAEADEKPRIVEASAQYVWAPDGLVMRVASAGPRLPPRLRRPLGVIGRAAVQIVEALPDLARAVKAEIKLNGGHRIRIGSQELDLEGEDVTLNEGDWIVNLGANWETPYPAAFFEMLAEKRLNFAILAHDLIPELFPEWAVRQNAENFRAWLRSSVMAAQVRFAVSKSTAADLVQCMNALDRQIPPPVVVPVGHVASHQLPDATAPVPGPYVLMVATIEIRKNHALMFRVWRRLLRELPEDQVPDLVFAGKLGWLTADLVQQLANTNWLNGKIKFINGPSDGQLSALYQNCLFTVFPSLYEGWGLPVSESLSYGKVVAASNRASLPEAGGEFCVYYDPENVSEAYRVVKELIENPGKVEAMEAQIAAAYQPPSWADTARAILRTLQPARIEAAELRIAGPEVGSRPGLAQPLGAAITGD